jgi:glycosyltransferase involved in cell wall biosynthesis
LRNIIVVNDHAYVNGGQAKVAIESAKELAAAGANVTFFAACGPMDQSLQSAGINVVCLNQADILSEPNRMTAATRGLWNRTAAKALRELVSDFDARSSIIHCHGFAKALSPAIGPVITAGPLAHVYTMHEYFLACPNGGFYDYKQRRICTRKALRPACLATNCDVRHASHKAWRVARQAVLWGPGAMPRNLRHIIYISEKQKMIMGPYLKPTTQLHYVPNPVSVDYQARVEAEHNDVFLYIGRLDPEKGALLFAQASKHCGVQAVFVGEGPERDAIQTINPDALITGWVHPDEVAAWLTKARCLVFPSLWYETFGLVAYEALSRGVPVICGAWNAAAEAVKDGVTGVIVADSRVAAWSEAINTASRQVKTLSIHAFETYWKDNARTPAHVEVLEGVYTEILNDRSRRAKRDRPNKQIEK